MPLRAPIRTAHEVWLEREGLILHVTDEAGQTGYGEVAPIPAFGTETVDEAEFVCRELGRLPTRDQIAELPASLGCLRRGVAAALAELDGADARHEVAEEEAGHDERSYRAVAALLPAGREAVAQLRVRLEGGFRIFKWKVGTGDMASELGILDDLCAELPNGARLRLDANGAWDRRQAERWLDRCAERPIEFVEQPCFVSARLDPTAARRSDDTLLGLANDYPTPVALDESLVSDGDIDRWLAAGWPGWFVVKPSLIGDVGGALAKLGKANAVVVFSSALETAVGARAALRDAFAWRGESKALGFGVWPLFADGRFDGPAAAPFIRFSDLERLNPESLWNALS